MLSVRIVLILFMAICSCQGNRPNAKVIPPEMVDEVIASAERPTGGSFAYNRPYPYLPYGQFGMPYGQFGMPYGQFGMPYGYMRPMPGFGQITGEEPEESMIEEPGEEEPVIEEPEEGNEESIKKRATDDEPIIIEIIGEEPFYEEPIIPVEPVYGEDEPEEEIISEDPDGETDIIEGPTGDEEESEVNYP